MNKLCVMNWYSIFPKIIVHQMNHKNHSSDNWIFADTQEKKRLQTFTNDYKRLTTDYLRRIL